MRTTAAFLLAITLSHTALAKEARWTALFVYGDGRVEANETLKNEQTCREAVCAVKYSRSCADETKYEVDQKIAAEKAEAEYKKRVATYRIDHPCVPETHEKTKYLRCPLPDGGAEYQTSDGSYSYVDAFYAIGQATIQSGIYDPARELRYSACFQQTQ